MAFRLAVVENIARLRFGTVTVLAGENGSGKSTMVEALAVAAGFNAEGGSRNLNFTTYNTHSDLGDHLQLVWNRRPKWGWFLRAETFYGMASHIAKDNDPYGGVAHIFSRPVQPITWRVVPDLGFQPVHRGGPVPT